jgi:hypothetical protein
MIQRIQSVYLLLAALAQAALFFPANAWLKANANATGYFTVQDGVFNISDALALQILFAASTVLCLVCIFIFKNRQLQLKLTRLNMLLTVLGLGMVAWLLYRLMESVSAGETQLSNIQYGTAWLSPFLAAIFSWLAMRGIRKDEALVKSMDRLR